jgi:hypothetical protein
MILSVFVALILTPALCATLLKPVEKEHQREDAGCGPLCRFFRWFNRMFEFARAKYEGIVGRSFDKPIRYLITVCDNARDNCPYVPGAQTTLHWPFPDPATNPRLEDFRAVRDMIRAKIESTELPL